MRKIYFCIMFLGYLSALIADVTAPYALILQAENFSAKQGGTYNSTKNEDPAISVENLGNGNWVKFDSVNFLNGQFDSLEIHATAVRRR